MLHNVFVDPQVVHGASESRRRTKAVIEGLLIEQPTATIYSVIKHLTQGNKPSIGNRKGVSDVVPVTKSSEVVTLELRKYITDHPHESVSSIAREFYGTIANLDEQEQSMMYEIIRELTDSGRPVI